MIQVVRLPVEYDERRALPWCERPETIAYAEGLGGHDGRGCDKKTCARPRRTAGTRLDTATCVVKLTEHVRVRQHDVVGPKGNLHAPTVQGRDRREAIPKCSLRSRAHDDGNPGFSDDIDVVV